MTDQLIKAMIEYEENVLKKQIQKYSKQIPGYRQVHTDLALEAIRVALEVAKQDYNKRKKENPKSITPEETKFLFEAQAHYYSLIATNSAHRGKNLEEIAK